MPKLLLDFGLEEEIAYSKWTRVVVITLIAYGLMPLMLKRNLSGLANFSFMGIIAILYIIGLIVV